MSRAHTSVKKTQGNQSQQNGTSSHSLSLTNGVSDSALGGIIKQIQKYATVTNLSGDGSWHIPAKGTNYYQAPAGDGGYIKFMFDVLNETRKLHGQTPYKFVDVSTLTEAQKKRLEGQSAYMSAKGGREVKNLPNFSKLVDSATNEIIESKNAMARARLFLLDQNTGHNCIESYLIQRGFKGNIKAMSQQIANALKANTTESGVVGTKEAIEDLAIKYKDTGIVFKVDLSSAGTGTVIIRPEEMKQAGFSPFQKVLNKRDDIHAQLRGGITWQACVPTGKDSKEGSIQYWIMKDRVAKKDGKPLTHAYATTDQFADADGAHRGNAVTEGDKGLAAIFPDKGKRDAFHWAQEIMIDRMLKEKGVTGGLHDDRAVISLYSIDLLFRDGIISKPAICEINARVSYVTRMIKQDAKGPEKWPLLSLNSNTKNPPNEAMRLMMELKDRPNGTKILAKVIDDRCLRPAFKGLPGAYFDNFQLGLWGANFDNHPEKYPKEEKKEPGNVVGGIINGQVLTPGMYAVSVFPGYKPGNDKKYIAAADNVGSNIENHLLSGLRPTVDTARHRNGSSQYHVGRESVRKFQEIGRSRLSLDDILSRRKEAFEQKESNKKKASSVLEKK